MKRGVTFHESWTNSGKPVEARIAVFARALLKSSELADQEVREGIAGERRGAAVEREAAVRAEVVRHVVGAAAVFAAEAELMRALRPADGIRQLIFIAQEAVGVAGVERAPVSGHGDVPLRLVVGIDVDAEVRERSCRDRSECCCRRCD